jgi:hypothetical protein
MYAMKLHSDCVVWYNVLEARQDGRWQGREEDEIRKYLEIKQTCEDTSPLDRTIGLEEKEKLEPPYPVIASRCHGDQSTKGIRPGGLTRCCRR